VAPSDQKDNKFYSVEKLLLAKSTTDQRKLLKLQVIKASADIVKLNKRCPLYASANNINQNNLQY